MKIKVLKLALNGAMLGIFIGFWCSILISILYGSGEYIFVTPQLIAQKGNEVNAVIFQGVLYMIYGSISSVTSLVYDKEHLSMIQKSCIHFFIILATFLIIIKLSFFVTFDFSFIVVFFIIFFAIYLLIWTIYYFYNKNLVNKINDKINKN